VAAPAEVLGAVGAARKRTKQGGGTFFGNLSGKRQYRKKNVTPNSAPAPDLDLDRRRSERSSTQSTRGVTGTYWQVGKVVKLGLNCCYAEFDSSKEGELSVQECQLIDDKGTQIMAVGDAFHAEWECP
jgi:hypothetical protein